LKVLLTLLVLSVAPSAWAQTEPSIDAVRGSISGSTRYIGFGGAMDTCIALRTIVIRDGCVKLTPKGVALAGFSRFYRTNLLPKKRLILDSYTDALTDPFRNSDSRADYTCQ
jgi:hypothetical protein